MRLFLLALHLFWVCDASASFSLFLTKSEISKLAEQNTVKPITPKLDGVIYNDSKNWVLWINGKQITPETTIDGIQIHEVTQNSAQITWMKNGKDVKETIYVFEVLPP